MTKKLIIWKVQFLILLSTLEMGHEIWLFRWRFGVSSILVILVSKSINRMKQYACDLVSVLLPLTSA